MGPKVGNIVKRGRIIRINVSLFYIMGKLIIIQNRNSNHHNIQISLIFSMQFSIYLLKLGERVKTLKISLKHFKFLLS
jgi:hypothetical protein